jgi:hypothetical protein
MSEPTQVTPMDVTTNTSTQGAHAGLPYDSMPLHIHTPTDAKVFEPMHDSSAPLVTSPSQTQITLIEKNSPTQHANPQQDINSDTSNNNTLPPSSPTPVSSTEAEPVTAIDPLPSPIKSPSPSDVQPQSSDIKVIKEPLQPDVELPEQQLNDSEDAAKSALKNLNSKRQLPDSIPTELDSKKIKRNELLLNDVNEKAARKIITKLLKDPWAPPFETPVDPELLGLPDYFDIIKRPMDLGTIRRNLDENKYPTVSSFADDVRLVFNNAMLYNAVRSDIHKAARNFLNEFEDMMRNTPWAHVYDTKIPEVTTPITYIQKGSLAPKPTPAIKGAAEVTHIEEPRTSVAISGSPPSPPLPVVKSERSSRSGSHARTGSKHGGYNCLVYYQNETIPYDFEWQHLHSREEFEQKLRSALNITSMAELEIGIKRSKPNFGRDVFVQLSPRWEEFPRVSCVLVKVKRQ